MKQLSLSPIKPKIKGLALGIRIRQLHHARIQFPSRFAGEHICTLKNITAKIVPFHFSSNQRTFPVHPTKGMILMLSGLIEFQESPILKIPSSALSRNYCRERKNTMSYLLVFLQFFLLGVIA
ncbi:MAG TPA: hypothetical protein VIE65_21220, partial [Methylobacter sp.]